jgi:hypothetical protein
MKITKVIAPFAILISLIVYSAPAAVSAYNGIDPSTPLQNYELRVCVESTDLDCVESIEVIHPDGTKEKALSRATSNDVSIWSYHELSTSGPEKIMHVWVTMTTRAVATAPPGPAAGVHIDGEPSVLSLGEKIVVTLRLSWLVPKDVSMYAGNASYEMTNIPGGKRIVIGGEVYITGRFDDYSNFIKDNAAGLVTKAEHDVPTLYFNIADYDSKAPYNSPEDRCHDYGFTVGSSNAVLAGAPGMSAPDTLNFNISAAHFLQSGKTNTGFFLSDIHTGYLDCLWPKNSVTKSSQLSITVTDTDGTAQVATTSVNIADGILHIRAYGFHYSSPVITVKSESIPTPTASPTPIATPTTTASAKPTPTKTPVVKKVTITCVKGKLVKKITAVKPVCPSGYKKK